MPSPENPPPIRRRLRPAVYWSALPSWMPLRDRFELARDAGFEGVEGRTVADAREAGAIAEAAAATGILIPSVVNADAWNCELYSDDPAEVESSVRGLLTTLHNARAWGAGVIQLIPGFKKGGVAYPEAYRRIQSVIRDRILPVAEDFGIVCGVENAWHSIVQGPLEYVRFIDEFESPYVRAFLDTGNMVFGHTENWVRHAGSRIVRIHLKDFRLQHSGSFSWRPHLTSSFGEIGEGAVDWVAVSAALRDIGYVGWGTCGEISCQLPARISRRALAGMSRHRLDRIPALGPMMTGLGRAEVFRTLKASAERVHQYFC